jgi:hypothetical protein
MSPNKHERHALVEAVRTQLRASRNATKLFDKLIESGRRGITHKQICEWKGLDYKDPWPQREASRLKMALEEFATGEGADIPWCCELVNTKGNDGFYQILVRDNVPPQGVRGFWSPHFWLDRDNYILITEPIFFRDRADKLYLRHFDVNVHDVNELLKNLPLLRSHPGGFVPVHHYVSIGEVRAKDEISKRLRDLRSKVRIEFWTSHEKLFDDLLRHHMILTGTWRASAAIREFQRTEDRLIYDHTVTGVRRRDGSEKEYLDAPGRYYYGLVTRIADRGTWTAKTVLACNHGPATHAISKDLFAKDSVDELAEQMTGEELWKGFPDCFQILFTVTLSPHSENFGHPKIMKWVIL